MSLGDVFDSVMQVTDFTDLFLGEGGFHYYDTRCFHRPFPSSLVPLLAKRV